MNINTLNTFKFYNNSSKRKFPKQLPIPCMSSSTPTSCYLQYGFCFILKLSPLHSHFVTGEQAAVYTFL